jgi:hypothetical protein
LGWPTAGRTRITLKRSGDTFWHRPPNAKANNVLLGMIWVDVAGDFVVENLSTGDRCDLVFTPCGWFGAGRYDISGHITTKDGGKVCTLISPHPQSTVQQVQAVSAASTHVWSAVCVVSHM